MRVAPWKLPVDAHGEREYYHHRAGKRVMPEWWTWSPGNLWDFLLGNMYVHLGEIDPEALTRNEGDEFKARKEHSWALAIHQLQLKARKRRLKEVQSKRRNTNG